MAGKGSARGAAAQLVRGVMEVGRTLAEQPEVLAPLAPAERARAQRLAAVTLRHLDSVDEALAAHLRRPPPPEVAALLSVAVAEMRVLGAPAHGVVSEAVDLVRASGKNGASMAGLANAVLRKLAEGPPLWPQKLPQWLRAPLIAAHGKAVVMAIEAAHARGAPLDLTLQRETEGLGGAPLPTGSLRLSDPGALTALPGYAEGDWWVQDASAALPARVLAAQPGERVLDLCAAPGGKTLQLAAAGAQVTAVDISDERLMRLRENLARTGLAAEVVTADALTFRAPPFDAILLDAPCSATGTIRRHPELPLIRDGSGIEALTALQAALLDHALNLLKPGGRLVYATCSLLPAEGEAQVRAALARHPGLSLLRPEAPGVEESWRVAEGLRLRPDHWPERGGMDGFFIAALRFTPPAR